MLIDFRKLVKNGNSSQVSLPHKLLRHLGWRSGCTLAVELLDEQHAVLLRKPTVEDFDAPKPALRHRGALEAQP